MNIVKQLESSNVDFALPCESCFFIVAFCSIQLTILLKMHGFFHILGADRLWDAKVLELPFEGNDKIVMYVVLPTLEAEKITRQEFDGFIARMSSSKLRYMDEYSVKKHVYVEIPEMDFHKKYSMSEVC